MRQRRLEQLFAILTQVGAGPERRVRNISLQTLPDNPVEELCWHAIFLAEIAAFGSRFPPGSVVRWFRNCRHVDLHASLEQRKLCVEQDQRRGGLKCPTRLADVERVEHRLPPRVL